MIDWTEKYRPKNLKQIIGNQKAVSTLQEWAKEWANGNPKKKAVVLSGKPGIGKTSCAYALANQFQWITIELNTSDARNKARIQAVATAGSNHQSFNDDGSYVSTKEGGRKIIILDEADNLYERNTSSSSDSLNLSDKGGKKEIIETVQTTKQPIILIVNDYYKLIKGSGSSLGKLCNHIKFFQPRSNEINELLYQISKNENIKVKSNLLEQLSTNCKGDIRSAIRDLQSLSIGKTEICLENIESLGFRDQEEVIFDTLSAIFSTVNIKDIKNRVRHVDLDPRMLLLWIVENIPRSYIHPYDKSKAYEHVSKADLYISRTLKRGNYGMWAYATDHMSYGVSLSKTNKPAYCRYQFPSWLKNRKKGDSKEDALLVQQLAKIHHCSIKKAKTQLYPSILKICGKNSINSKEFLLTNKESEINKNKEKEDVLKHQSKKDIKEKNEKNQKQQTLFS